VQALVTGASGFIGGHIVEVLKAEGHQVFALVRATSKTSHLKQTGAELIIGDVTDRDSLVRACRGMDWVFHTAALVEIVGRWQDFYQVGVKGTSNLVEAAAGAQVSRFVHFSSMVVCGTRPGGRSYNEETPYDSRVEPWNHYVREKILSEQVVLEAHRAGRIRATVIRPSIVIGPRDRSIVPRLIRLMRSPAACTVGDGTNKVAFVVVEELAATSVKAAGSEVAEGRVYNLSGRDTILQKDMARIITEAAGLRFPKYAIPKGLAMASAALLENLWKLVGARQEPIITRMGIALAAEDWNVDCSRARQELGWVGDSNYKDAIERYLYPR